MMTFHGRTERCRNLVDSRHGSSITMDIGFTVHSTHLPNLQKDLGADPSTEAVLLGP
jgi:hypothetical protein